MKKFREIDKIVGGFIYHSIRAAEGQYIGVHDINGKEIYEGDIVKGKTGGGVEIEGVVTFLNGSFYIKGKYISFYRWDDYEVAVISNIYENPTYGKESKDIIKEE